MLYFYNNLNVTSSWGQAYQELNYKYQMLTTDYTKAVQLRDSLKTKIQILIKENQILKAEKEKKKFPLQDKDLHSLGESFEPFEREITIKLEKKTNEKVKRQQSAESDTKHEGQSYECTYEGCGKVYSSPVSMNLHIKMKHNGGTKKERQAYARILLQAQERGQQAPKMNINLPPNFLQEYRTSYEYTKKYSM